MRRLNVLPPANIVKKFYLTSYLTKNKGKLLEDIFFLHNFAVAQSTAWVKRDVIASVVQRIE